MKLTLPEIVEQLAMEINATPTGQEREDLTSAQIYLLKVEQDRKAKA